jgi:hypothetical protein
VTAGAPLPYSLPATALLGIQLTESIQRQSANVVRHLTGILHIAMDLLVSEKIQRRRGPFLCGPLGLLELIRGAVA